MVYQKSNLKAANQADPPVTRQINVTDLKPYQRRALFISCLNQAGFTGFIKNQADKQTYFTFTYEN